MRICRISYIIVFILVTSCSGNQKHNNSVVKPGKATMADLNRYLVEKDRERIKNYIERKNLDMKETATGLWYQVIREGSGKQFNDNDRVRMEYDCSLLDGTQCYSSRELGVKEVIIGKGDTEQGLNEGPKFLRPGAQAIFILPPYLAYGFVGDRKMIPPRSVIVYNVNILPAK